MRLPYLVLTVMLGGVVLASANAQAPGGKAPPTPVIVAELTKQPLVDEVEALGTLRANESVNLTASVTERVTAVNFQDGQRVKQGDILVEMDAAEEMALLEEEQSTLREAERQLKRVKPLAAKGVASDALLDERKRNVAGARARMEAIRSRINERRIAAPFDGVVGLRNVSVGALVQPGTDITTVDDDTVMKLDFPVPSVFIDALKTGAVIEAKAKAFPDRTFKGSISSVDSRIDPVTRSIMVRALIDNPEQLLKPGLLMRVELQKNPRQTLLLPEEALMLNGDAHHVWLVQQEGEGYVVTKRKVEIGVRRKGDVEILSGINEGDQIVTHGVLRLREGAAVNIKATERENETLNDMLGSGT